MLVDVEAIQELLEELIFDSKFIIKNKRIKEVRNKIKKIYNLLKNYTIVSVIMDFSSEENELISYKDSPIDKGKEVFELLYNNREMIEDVKDLEELYIKEKETK